jgi:hypothetical protein
VILPVYSPFSAATPISDHRPEHLLLLARN